MTNRLAIEGSERNDYATPWPVVRFLERHFNKFDLDPCCYPETAKAPSLFTKEDDALSRDWFGHVYINPPWGQPDLSQFIEHAYNQSLQRKTKSIIALIPAANTDTHAWHKYIVNGANYVYLIRGRIPFELDGVRQNSNNVPTAFVIWERTSPATRARLGSFDVKDIMRG